MRAEIEKGKKPYKPIQNHGKEPHVPTKGIHHTKQPRFKELLILGGERK